MRYSDKSFDSYEIFGQYIEWRVDHPSNDLMSELLHAECGYLHDLRAVKFSPEGRVLLTLGKPDEAMTALGKLLEKYQGEKADQALGIIVSMVEALKKRGKEVALVTSDITQLNPLGEKVQASPAISQGQIFIRTEKNLFCIGKR